MKSSIHIDEISERTPIVLFTISTFGGGYEMNDIFEMTLDKRKRARNKEFGEISTPIEEQSYLGDDLVDFTSVL
jgi:hypothetical protein